MIFDVLCRFAFKPRRNHCRSGDNFAGAVSALFRLGGCHVQDLGVIRLGRSQRSDS